MKQSITCLIIIVCSCLLPLAVSAGTIQIVTFHYPPVMDSSKPNGGLMGDIVHSAFSEVNIESEFVYYPAKRMLAHYIGTEKYVACVGPVVLVDRQSEDRKSQVVRIPPLVDILMVFAYHKPTHGKKPTTYNRLNELSGFTAGTILGSNTIPLLKTAGINVEETLFESQMKLLKANRIDFAVIGLLAGLDSIAKFLPENKDDFAFMKKPVMELPTSIYFNKPFPQSDEYVERFETGLNAIIKNGRYLQILEKYYGPGNIPSEYKPLFHALGVQYPF